MKRLLSLFPQKENPMKNKNFHSTYRIDKRWYVWCFEIRIVWCRNDGIMGRFGEGWNWRLGFQAGGETIVFHLLVLTISLSWLKRKTHEEKDKEETTQEKE